MLSIVERVHSTVGNIMISVGDILSTVGRCHENRGGDLEYRGGVQYCGGYHEYHMGCSVLCGIKSFTVLNTPWYS